MMRATQVRGTAAGPSGKPPLPFEPTITHRHALASMQPPGAQQPMQPSGRGQAAAPGPPLAPAATRCPGSNGALGGGSSNMGAGAGVQPPDPSAHPHPQPQPHTQLGQAPPHAAAALPGEAPQQQPPEQTAAAAGPACPPGRAQGLADCSGSGNSSAAAHCETLHASAVVDLAAKYQADGFNSQGQPVPSANVVKGVGFPGRATAGNGAGAGGAGGAGAAGARQPTGGMPAGAGLSHQAHPQPQPQLSVPHRQQQQQQDAVDAMATGTSTAGSAAAANRPSAASAGGGQQQQQQQGRPTGAGDPAGPDAAGTAGGGLEPLLSGRGEVGECGDGGGGAPGAVPAPPPPPAEEGMVHEHEHEHEPAMELGSALDHDGAALDLLQAIIEQHHHLPPVMGHGAAFSQVDMHMMHDAMPLASGMVSSEQLSKEGPGGAASSLRGPTVCWGVRSCAG